MLCGYRTSRAKLAAIDMKRSFSIFALTLLLVGCVVGPDFRARYGHSSGEASAQRPPVDVWRAECRGLLFRRRQETDLPVVARRCEVRPDIRDEHRRQRPAHGLDRQGTHHLQLLLSRRQEDSLCINAPGQPRVPAETGLFQGLRLGRLLGIRHLHRESGRLESQATDQDARLRRGSDDFDSTARRSLLLPCATAISISTRWTPTART